MQPSLVHHQQLGLQATGENRTGVNSPPGQTFKEREQQCRHVEYRC